MTAENGAVSVRQCPCGASVVEGRGHLQKVLGKHLLGVCLPLAWEHVGDNTPCLSLAMLLTFTYRYSKENLASSNQISSVFSSAIMLMQCEAQQMAQSKLCWGGEGGGGGGGSKIDLSRTCCFSTAWFES